MQFNEVFLPSNDEFKSSSSNKEFFIQLDPILKPICEELQREIYKKEVGKPGKYPFKVSSMIKAHLFAKLNNDIPYRALQREMYRNEELSEAFGFKKVPSHQAMSDFRKRLGKDRLDEIINHVIKTAIEMNLTDTKEIIIDSAPIKTFVNFAKANKTPSFDIEKIKDLYRHLNLKELVSRFNLELRSPYSLESYIAFKILSELGGFISFNSAYNFVKKSKELQEIFQFISKFPVQVTIKTNLFKLESQSRYKELMDEIIKRIIKFFHVESNSLPDEMNDLKYFFGILRENCFLVDPEARIGYCPSKDEFYLGYKIHLIISKKTIQC